MATENDSLPLTRKFSSLLELNEGEINCLEALQETREHFSAGTDIISEGDEFTHVHAAISGWFMRYRQLENGRRQIINLLLPGNLMGHFGTVTTVADHTVTTLTDVEVATFDPGEFVDLFARCPRLAIVFAWMVGRDDLIVSEQVLRLGRLSAYKRTAHICVELLDRLTAIDLARSDSSFHLPVTQEILSDILGLSTVHMSRTLSALKRDGVLSIEDKILRIENVEKLRNATEAASNFSSDAQLPDDVQQKLDAMVL